LNVPRSHDRDAIEAGKRHCSLPAGRKIHRARDRRAKRERGSSSGRRVTFAFPTLKNPRRSAHIEDPATIESLTLCQADHAPGAPLAGSALRDDVAGTPETLETRAFSRRGVGLCWPDRTAPVGGSWPQLRGRSALAADADADMTAIPIRYRYGRRAVGRNCGQRRDAGFHGLRQCRFNIGQKRKICMRQCEHGALSSGKREFATAHRHNIAMASARVGLNAELLPHYDPGRSTRSSP
jgi:hypothetical protein